MFDDATIEHVMPQTLTDDWRNMLASDREPDKIHNLLIDTIGNLTLTAYNPELSNLNFEEKKKIYASSHYSLNEYFAGCPIWTVEQIEDRAGELWERARDIWPAPVQSSEPVADGQLESDSLVERTDNKLLEAKREVIIGALSRREGVPLTKIRGKLYSSADGNLRAACPVSRRYTRSSSSYYWYGYSEELPSFLSQGKRSFLVLGCMDKDSAYAIPNETIDKLLTQLYKTPGIHWHIIVDENERGQLELSIRDGGKMPLNNFELKLK